MLSKYRVPSSINYIAAFLTFRCGFGCSYCINKFGSKHIHSKEMSLADWRKGLERLITRPDLPVTLQGGEPTMYKDWGVLAWYIKCCGINVDILTNCDFDLYKFINTTPVQTFARDAKYASIRVSYHPEQQDAYALASKVMILKVCYGYNIGIWGINYPLYIEANDNMAKICKTAGIDFRMKEFLGEHDGIWHGKLKYPDACVGRVIEKSVFCKTTEMLVAPSGHIYRCHSDLYTGINPVGHILDKELPDVTKYRECGRYGMCNPCDVKIKTNRLQEYGHTSVEITRMCIDK